MDTDSHLYVYTISCSHEHDTCTEEVKCSTCIEDIFLGCPDSDDG